MRVSLARIAAGGLAACVLVALGGAALERNKLGRTDDAAVARVEAELRSRMNTSAEALGAMAAQAASARDLIADAPRDLGVAQRLFDLLDQALPAGLAATTGITIYDRSAAPVAWVGRVSDLARPQIDGPAALFVAVDAQGPRLVRVEPVADRKRPGALRLGTIVAEQLLGDGQAAPFGNNFVLSDLALPVSIMPGGSVVPVASPYSFAVPSAGGRLLIEADVKATDIAAAHARWQARIRAALLSVCGVTLLLYAGVCLELRRHARTRAGFAKATAALLIILGCARVIFWFATGPLVDSGSTTSPIDLLLDALLLAASVWLLVDLVERWRVAVRKRPILSSTLSAVMPVAAGYLAAGIFDVTLLWAYERFLGHLVAETTLNLLHFSLHPLNDPGRLAVAFGLVLFHAGVIWSAALAIRLAGALWRVPHLPWIRVVTLAAWALGAGAATWTAAQFATPVPILPLLVALSAAAGCAYILGRPRGPLRRASQAARLVAMYVALVVPAVAMYPALHAFAVGAKEGLVASTFAPEAASQREDLRNELYESLREIDRLPNLPALVAALPENASPTTNQAFEVWSKTALAKSRVTSAVELYGPRGRLISRFSKLPQYDAQPHLVGSCGWEAVDEPMPLRSSERHVLRASRSVCVGDRREGSIVVRVMLDYGTLPFISSQSPYAESLNPEPQPFAETQPGRDVEFVVYGWSRAPLYASGPAVWTLPDSVFERMLESREPLWAAVTRDAQPFRVYFFNDRFGIYALGYPVITWVGHLVNLAELVILTGALYVLLLLGATLFNAFSPGTSTGGRALLREIRSSFYRKLFLAFVASAVVPVVILALAVRAYFSNQFSASVEQNAVKTVTVAERLVEDYATLPQRGATSISSIDDQIMVLVGRAIDEDVSFFERARLQATSEPDLFASGLLSPRTPSLAYRKIVLERLPTFVDVEPAGGYLLAAAPVRARDREGIVTVPLTLRYLEIEQQIDELDRGIWSASVLFVLLGAALGYWMAERIADPVNRLTRATRRIARGDLDARIAATSSDELRRLVEDFNRMAADLKRQRTDRERTQRLEAWAEMARQVAHDIKNPLTPIQLSAEHARRVNLDRGRPLSPVLDECVNAILKQVTLLRQIAAEFSSFASSPTPRPEPTDVGALIAEVVEPYRVGLSGRVLVEVRCNSDLPQVSIDRTLFARALTNVIENALHAIPGQGSVTISATPEVQLGEGAARSLIVQITDTGVGMDEQALKRIFEPYFSTKATGTGLGLTIAKRNVEATGGAIQVESRRGAGTTVTIRLPVATQPLVSPVTAAAS